jgi:UDP-galactopyranose mutase
MVDPVLIVGAGLSGAVIAQQLAQAGYASRVIDSRHHVAGNCHTARDDATDVMVHTYGPHIFHTDDAQVWDFVNRFATFQPFRHQVRSTVGGQVYSMPVNLLTINQFFGTALSPDQARDLIATKTRGGETPPVTFEDQALRFMGQQLYDAFFRGYTEKQWGCPPDQLPASILKRLPLRFNYDDNYFFHRFQGMPRDGYTPMVAAMLDHPLIDLQLATPYHADMARSASHVFWSGSLDGYFDYQLGRLAYRTLDFKQFRHEGDFQGCAVMNYGDRNVPFTRITEHKHFSPWEDHASSICTREYSRAAGPDDIPYYPVRLVQDKALLSDYVQLARGTTGVTFMGRLGTYRYLDMDVTIREAMDVAQAHLSQGTAPAFVASPL